VAPTVSLLLAGTTRLLDVGSILRAARPDVYPGDRVEEAATDVLHRVLFGLRPGVNAGDAPAGRAPSLPIGAALRGLIDRVGSLQHEARQPDRRALAALLAAGHDVVVRRGHQGTRVDDVVAAAGVSHGAFYRYFENRDEFVRTLAVIALVDLSVALSDLPDGAEGADRAALRRWLRRYNAVHSERGALVRVWAEAIDEALRADHAAVYDWGRRRLARLVDGRGYGDVDAEAIVLLAVIEAFGSTPRTPVEVDVAVRVVERGFLARPAVR
jgi:AcrR family transcriptional regulator